MVQQNEPEYTLLRELAHLKVELSKIDDLSKKEAQILYRVHEFLTSDGIAGYVSRYKISSYTKIFAL